MDGIIIKMNTCRTALYSAYKDKTLCSEENDTAKDPMLMLRGGGSSSVDRSTVTEIKMHIG